MAKGVLRIVAAAVGVFWCSGLYSYLMRRGLLDFRPHPAAEGLAGLTLTGPRILATTVKVGVGLLIIGSAGPSLALLVDWAAAGLRSDQDRRLR